MYAIETENLTRIYNRRFKALDSLSIKVERGMSVGYLGPNGAGKTTTIRILTGLIRPTSGRALVDGRDVVGETTSALSSVGFVPEAPEFYAGLTPLEIMYFLGKLRGMTSDDIRDRSLEVLEIVKLKGSVDVHVNRFSKGMKQRFALACALLHRPRILILDEPASGLDPKGRVEMREILRSLKGRDTTIFMSSHILTEVQEVCDHAAIINHGKLLVFERMDVLGGMAHSQGIRIVFRKPLDEWSVGLLQSLGEAITIERRGAREVVLSTEGGAPLVEENILRDLLKAGLGIESYGPSESSLERRYLELVGDAE